MVTNVIFINIKYNDFFQRKTEFFLLLKYKYVHACKIKNRKNRSFYPSKEETFIRCEPIKKKKRTTKKLLTRVSLFFLSEVAFWTSKII